MFVFYFGYFSTENIDYQRRDEQNVTQSMHMTHGLT